MNRRVTVATITVAAAFGLTACGAGGGRAAEVLGSSISTDRLDTLLTTLAEHDFASIDEQTSTVAASEGRTFLTLLIRDRLDEEFLAEQGEEITAADRDEAAANLADQVNELPDDVKALAVDATAASLARGRVASPPVVAIRALYEAGPGSVGMVCARRAGFTTEAAAESFVDELDGGALDAASYGDLAAAQDPMADLSDAAGACYPLSAYGQAVDAGELDDALDASPGEIVGPVAAGGTWQVLQMLPWADAEEQVTTQYEAAAGEALYAAYVTRADVSVGSRYGRWDRFSGTVVGLE